MAARGSQLERVTQFFREASLDVARVTFQLVEEIMTKRMEEYEAAAKSQHKAASVPRKKRQTKEQIAAGKNATTTQETLANA